MHINRSFINSVLIIGFVAIIELANSVLLGRWLPAEAYGKFKILNTSIMLLGGILILGQDSVLIRTICGEGGLDYSWRGLIQRNVLLGSLLSLPFLAFFVFFYEFTFEAVWLFAGSISLIFIRLSSSINRALGNTTISLFVDKSASLFFFLVIISLIAIDRIEYQLLIPVYGAVWLMAVALAKISTIPVGCGTKSIDRRMRIDGYFLFFISTSFILMKNMDRFFLAKMLSFSEVGAYSAVITVTQGFTIAATGIWYVLMPRYAQKDITNVRQDLSIAVMMAAVLLAMYLLFGDWLLNILFKGKFDEFSFLIKYFTMIGVCSILYVIPGSFIGGKSTRKALSMFLYINVFTVLLNCIGNYFFILKLGISGAALSTLLCWVVRLASSIYVMRLGNYIN